MEKIMNINLIKSVEYKELVNKIVVPCSWKKVVPIDEYPYDEYKYYEKNLNNNVSLNTFKIIKQMNMIYDIDQHVYGILNLNGIDYVIDVDNEFQLHVVGDTESNWLYDIFDLHDNLDKYELFMKECNENLGVALKKPDFKRFRQIKNEFLNPLINK